MGVEAGRDEQPGRVEGGGERAPAPRRPRRGTRRRSPRPGSGRLIVVPRPAPAPDLAQPAGARVQRVLVERRVGDALVAPEDVLGAVAVMGVVVDDQHALAPVGQGGGRDRHVVEQAEPHRPRGGGVVAGRTHRAERAVGVARIEGVDRGQPGAGGEQRRVVGRRRSWPCRRRASHRPPPPSRVDRRHAAPRRARAPAPRRVAAGAPPARPPSASPAASMPARTDRSRSGRSGCPRPRSWSRYRSWVSRRTVTPPAR